MTATWTIRGITLPIEPSSFNKRTIRTQQTIPVTGDFPEPAVNQATKFEFNIKGYIWPKSLAVALDEATKNAETENISISVVENSVEDPWLSGMYSVSNSDVGREKPLYDSTTGAEVYEYDISFVKYADLGSSQPGDEGGPDTDEKTGFMDLPTELGFDTNGDGDIDPDELFNLFTNILTFGVVGG